MILKVNSYDFSEDCWLCEGEDGQERKVRGLGKLDREVRGVTGRHVQIDYLIPEITRALNPRVVSVPTENRT